MSAKCCNSFSYSSRWCGTMRWWSQPGRSQMKPSIISSANSTLCKKWVQLFSSGLNVISQVHLRHFFFFFSSSKFHCEKRQVCGVFTALCHMYLNADRLPVFQVLFNSDVQTVRDIVRSRSQSPVRYVSQKQVLTLKTWERNGLT